MVGGINKALAEGSALKREHVVVIERGREDKTCCPPCCMNCLSHCCFSNCFCCPFWVVIVAMIIVFVVIVPVIMLVKPVPVKPVSSPYTALNNTGKQVSRTHTAFDNTVKPVSSPYTALYNTSQHNSMIHKDGVNYSALKDGDVRLIIVNGVEMIPEINTAEKYRARSKYFISL